MAFTLMEEVQHNSVVAWGTAEREVKDFFKEEWVEEVCITMLSEDLEEAVVLMEREGELEAAGATLGVVVEIMKLIPVEGEEDLIMQEKISKMNVATIQLDMVR